MIINLIGHKEVWGVYLIHLELVLIILGAVKLMSTLSDQIDGTLPIFKHSVLSLAFQELVIEVY